MKTKMKLWKNLKYNGVDYDNYLISDKGDVQSVRREFFTKNGARRVVKGKIIAVRTNRIEPYYFFDAIYDEGEEHRRKTIYVHRAVYESFHGSIPKGMYVTHINGDTFDNRLSNLQIITHSELQKRNLEKYPENRYRLKMKNVKSGYYTKMKGKRALSNLKILAIKELSKRYNPKVISEMVGVSLSTVYKYLKQ